MAKGKSVEIVAFGTEIENSNVKTLPKLKGQRVVFKHASKHMSFGGNLQRSGYMKERSDGLAYDSKTRTFAETGNFGKNYKKN